MPDTPQPQPASAEPTPPSTPPVTPPPAEEPKMAPPSPTVQPFVSGGGPPAPVVAPKKPMSKGLIVVAVIIVLLAIAGGAYAYLRSIGATKSTANPYTYETTPTATSAPTDDLDGSVKQLDNDMSDFGNNLSGADATLGDKQGDLSE